MFSNAMLSSIPSSAHPVPLNDDRPSDTEMEHDGDSVMLIGLVRSPILFGWLDVCARAYFEGPFCPLFCISLWDSVPFNSWAVSAIFK